MSEICPECRKEFKKKRQVNMHRVAQHGYRKRPESLKPEQSKTEPQPQLVATKLFPSDLLEKLKAFGIEPSQILETLAPLVETSVIKTLERMQLGEAINKRLADIETKLSQQYQTTLQPPQPTTGLLEGNNQSNTQMRDNILMALAQKFISGNSSSGTSELERLSGYLGLTRKIADAFYTPIQEAEIRAQKRIIGQLELYRKAGASPKKATDLAIEEGKK